MSSIQSGTIRLACDELEANEITLILVDVAAKANEIGVQRAHEAAKTILKEKGLEHLTDTRFCQQLSIAALSIAIANRKRTN